VIVVIIRQFQSQGTIERILAAFNYTACRFRKDRNLVSDSAPVRSLPHGPFGYICDFSSARSNFVAGDDKESL
jgi:hypothetical protein